MTKDDRERIDEMEPVFDSMEEMFDAYGFDQATRDRVNAALDAEEESEQPRTIH
jgi:hypothetical protein